ncbi:MAG: hypothetical protein ACOC2J_01885 [bacterium]
MSCQLIKNRAIRGMKRIKEIKPFKISTPYDFVVKYKEEQYVDGFIKDNPEAKRIDKYTIQMREAKFSDLRF